MTFLAQSPALQSATTDKEAYEPAKPHDRRYIHRVGPDGGTGWNVNIRRGRETFRKRFSDSKHRSEHGALTAAKAWRDEINRLHPTMTKQQVATSRQLPTSGRQGVIRSVIRLRRKDGSFSLGYFWDAASPNWHTPRRHRRFSVAKYGEDEAFRLAVAAREAFEAKAKAAGRQPFKSEQPSQKSTAMRNIHRIDYSYGIDKAWAVIIKRANLAAPLNKQFSDRAHGDETASLAAAIAWRDKMERLHPRLDRKARLARPSKANSSGVKGVFQQFTPRLLADGSTRVSTFWTAKTPTWVIPERTRCFSIEKYGETEAFRMAVEARKAFEAQSPD